LHQVESNDFSAGPVEAYIYSSLPGETMIFDNQCDVRKAV